MVKPGRFIVEPVVNPRADPHLSLKEQILQGVHWWRTTSPDGTWFFDVDRDRSIADARRWYYAVFPGAGPAAVEVHSSPR